MSLSLAKTRLRCLVAENVILERFRVGAEIHISCEIVFNDSLSSRNVRFRLPTICSSGKCYFGAIPSYQAEFDVHVRFFSMNPFPAETRSGILMICGSRKYYFGAIQSYEVEIEISCEILLNESLLQPKHAFSTGYDL